MAESTRPSVALAPVAGRRRGAGVPQPAARADRRASGRPRRPGAEVLIKPNLFQTEPGFHMSPALLAAIARAVTPSTAPGR